MASIWNPGGSTPVGVAMLADLASIVEGRGQELVFYPIVTPEIAAGATIVRAWYEPGNVLRYGADRTGATSSQAAFDAAKEVAKMGLGQIIIPWGDFKVNWLFTDSEGDYLWIKTAGFRTRLLPVSSASPVIDIYGSATGGGVTGLRMESMLIDSQASGVPTGAGIGVRVRGVNPGFVWKCKIAHLYIRGFDDGFIIDCDINLGEVFDNDFDQIEALSCDDRSVDIKGLYNRFGRIFVTESGNYAMVNSSSACTFDQIVTDGPVTFGAGGGIIDALTIEGTNGVGTTSVVDISGPNYNFGNILLKDIPAAKYVNGVAVSAASANISFSNITITGTYPEVPILLQAGSNGIIGSASTPGGTKISTSTAVISKWRFLGDVSSVFVGDRYLDPNLFVQNTGETVLKGPLFIQGAASNPGAGNVSLGKTTATTVGAAGGASALPATPLGYLIAYVGTTQVKIPYYNN